MRDETKPVRCGCGGEAKLTPAYYGVRVKCTKCEMETPLQMHDDVAVRIWNRAMGAFGRGEYWEDDNALL